MGLESRVCGSNRACTAALDVYGDATVLLSPQEVGTHVQEAVLPAVQGLGPLSPCRLLISFRACRKYASPTRKVNGDPPVGWQSAAGTMSESGKSITRKLVQSMTLGRSPAGQPPRAPPTAKPFGRDPVLSNYINAKALGRPEVGARDQRRSATPMLPHWLHCTAPTAHWGGGQGQPA